MRNLLNNLKTKITSRRRRTTAACDGDTASKDVIDDGKVEDLVEELSELDRITKRDSKRERRQKFRRYFERNNVCMVSAIGR